MPIKTTFGDAGWGAIAPGSQVAPEVLAGGTVAPTVGGIPAAPWGLPQDDHPRGWGEDLLPKVTPQMQYGKSYGWGDVPRTPQGKKWLEERTAAGRAPTAAQLRAYESQFYNIGQPGGMTMREAMGAWEQGKWTAETGRAASLFAPLDVPTGFPSSINEAALPVSAVHFPCSQALVASLIVIPLGCPIL